MSLLGSVTYASSCSFGRGCCADYFAALSGPLKTEIRFVSIYTTTDRVVLPESCLDPAAEHLPVSASHQGMAMSREVWGHLVRILA